MKSLRHRRGSSRHCQRSPAIALGDSEPAFSVAQPRKLTGEYIARQLAGTVHLVVTKAVMQFDILGRFDPKLVKAAQVGEKAED